MMNKIKIEALKPVKGFVNEMTEILDEENEVLHMIKSIPGDEFKITIKEDKNDKKF